MEPTRTVSEIKDAIAMERRHDEPQLPPLLSSSLSSSSSSSSCLEESLSVADPATADAVASAVTTTTMTALATQTALSGFPGPASGPASGSLPRRSGRERISTTVTINGHTVLRKNNYSVTADSYIYDLLDDDDDDDVGGADANITHLQQQQRGKKVVVRKQPTGPRVETSAEIARRRHKAAVQNASSQKRHLQMSFLAKNVDILEPFCEDSIIQQLRDIRDNKDDTEAATAAAAAVAVSGSSSSLTDPVHVPSTIKATLRPYQKKGLDFLVRMHRQNVPCIIGDEMGL